MRKLILTAVIVMTALFTSAQIGMTREEIGADNITLSDRTIKFAYDENYICTSFLVETKSKKVAKYIIRNMMENFQICSTEEYIWCTPQGYKVYYLVLGDSHLFLTK